MLTKLWCLVTGGILISIAASKLTPGIENDEWTGIVYLGVGTLIFGLIQTIIDYGKEKKWWD